MDEQLYTPAEVGQIEDLTPEEKRKLKGLLVDFEKIQREQKDFNEDHNHDGINSQPLESGDATSIIDDTAGNGDTTVVYSADKVYDLLAGKVATTGDETIAGIKTFSSFPITPSSAPTTDYQVANKKYTSDSITAERTANTAKFLTASNNLLMSSDTEHSGTYGSYTKIKEVKVNYNGTIRVKVDLKTVATSHSMTGWLFKNSTSTSDGTDLGGLSATVTDPGSGVWKTFTWTSITVSIGDTLQLYVYDAETGYIANFRVYADVSSVTSVTSLLD